MTELDIGRSGGDKAKNEGRSDLHNYAFCERLISSVVERVDGYVQVAINLFRAGAQIILNRSEGILEAKSRLPFWDDCDVELIDTKTLLDTTAA